MQAVSEGTQPTVFILWGNFAASKKKFINEKKTSDYREPASIAAFFLSRFHW
jgi:uracil DNA glycosylase